MVALVLGGVTAALAANPEPPTVTTGSASSVATTSAQLAGTVNPGGAESTVQFKYGTSTNYGLTTPVQTLPAETTAQTVTAPVTGLTGNTTYHYRLIATNAAGHTEGADKTFKTAAPPARATVSTGGAKNVSRDSATVTGTVDPNGNPTSWSFDVGTTTGYGSRSPFTDAGSGTSARGVELPLNGLLPNTKYHYRLLISVNGAVTYGADRTFTTSKVPLAVGISAGPNPVKYGQTVGVHVQLTGSGVSRQAVTLQSNPFPYTRGFRNVGSTVLTDSRGAARFLVAPFSSSTQFRVTIKGAQSQVLTVSVVPRIQLRVRKVKGHRLVRVFGTVRPGTLSGVISIQRRTPAGRFVLAKRVGLTAGSDGATFKGTLRYFPGRVYRAVYRTDNGPVLTAHSLAKRSPR